MVLMVNFGTAALYSHAKEQKEFTLYHAAVAGVGDEAFDSPPGPLQYVLYVRKAANAISLTAYMTGTRPMKPTLTMVQLKQLALIVVSRL